MAVNSIENVGQSRSISLLIYEKGNYQFLCGKLSKAAVTERNMKNNWLDGLVSGLAAAGPPNGVREPAEESRAQSLVTIGERTSRYLSGVDIKQSVVFTKSLFSVGPATRTPVCETEATLRVEPSTINLRVF